MAKIVSLAQRFCVAQCVPRELQKDPRSRVVFVGGQGDCPPMVGGNFIFPQFVYLSPTGFHHTHHFHHILLRSGPEILHI